MDKEQRTQKQANIFVTLLVILMTAAVIIAVAGAVAKNKSVARADKETKHEKETVGDALREDMVHDAEDEVTLPPEAEAEETTQKTDETTEKETEDVSLTQTLPTFTSPVEGSIQKGYSMAVPVFSLTMEDYRTHSGVDLYAPSGTNVTAAADGTVREIWNDPMMGKCISVSHSGGAVTTYKNLSEDTAADLEAGKAVSAGEILGTVGDTALEEVAEESHLHFEMTVNGASVDPGEYITFSSSQSYED